MATNPSQENGPVPGLQGHGWAPGDLGNFGGSREERKLPKFIGVTDEIRQGEFLGVSFHPLENRGFWKFHLRFFIETSSQANSRRPIW